MEILTGREIGRLLGAGLLGAVIGVVGTGIHRSTVPWGLVLALLTVFCGAVLVRAWIGWAGMLALAMGVVTAVGVLGQSGPGGDVLIVADPLGYLWYGGALVVALAGLLPARWFSREPLRRTGSVTADP
ncbi:MAG TPA: hypothetical protein VN257_08150 [Actinotalea sp.]|nr:hypothetical protein [Actinotalea sp.]